MRIPTLLYGEQREVWRRCRRAIGPVLREERPLIAEFEAEGMLDTAEYPGLLVLGGPRPLLGKTNHFQCYVPALLYAHGLNGAQGPANPMVDEALFQAMLRQPWSLLCLLCNDSFPAFFRNDNPERYRRLVQAILPNWQALDSEGARYTSASNIGDRLWAEPTTLARALYFVGVPAERLRGDLPPGGVAALVAGADPAQAGDLIDLAAGILAHPPTPEPSRYVYTPPPSGPPPVYMSEQMEAALRANDPEIVHRLVAAGEPFDAMDQEGTWSPLLWAAYHGHTELARFLLDRGTPIEDRWVEGESPLMVAAWHGHPDTVRLLLDRGADPNYVTEKGWDVVQFAEMSGNPEVIAMLQQVYTGRTEEDDPEE